MIRFKQIKYKNFLSTGDQPTTIELDKTITSIFIGGNGAGKSTFIDAIVYALFGKPFRKVRLGQLINNVNEKGLESEVIFEVNNKNYRVVRGMKPSIFEIYVDDVLIPQPATTADYQSILENDILKLNYKSFTQIIVLGSASFKPFMQLKLGDRREIIEDLLDISVFSEMNAILKGKIKECKEEIDSITHKIELIKERYSSKREYLNKVTQDHESQLKETKRKMDDLVKTIDDYKKIHKNYKTKKIELTTSIEAVGNVEDKMKEIQTLITDLNMKIFTQEQAYETACLDAVTINDLTEKVGSNNKVIDHGKVKLEELEAELKSTTEVIDAYGNFEDRDQVKTDIAIKSSEKVAEELKLKFYTDNDDCPECKQSIDPEFKEATITEITLKISAYDKDLEYCLDRIKVIEREMIEKADFEKTKEKIQSNIATVKTAVDKLESQNTVLQEDISSRKIKTPEERKEMEDAVILLRVELAAHTEDISEIKKQNDMLTKIKDELIIVEKELALSEQFETSNNVTLETLRKELETLESKPVTDDVQAEIDILALEIKELDSSLSKKKSGLHYFGIVQKLLKDDGLKTKIIRKFLPIINATVNMYLDRFDFPINFEFDENFNETIRSNYRSDFCYYSFSEGEKSRIDLALLFTWRETALKKARNATNIIIFDEIFDGSLDGNGIENFMNILGLDKEGYSSFIISHKDETINSRFDRTVEFIKNGHFSKMMEK